jgi:hypothetical protein
MFSVKGKEIKKEGGGYSTDVTPEEMTAEFEARQPGFNFDPLQRGETADLFENSVRESQPLNGELTPDEMQARRPIDTAQAGEIPTDQIPARDAPVTPEDVRAAEGQGNLTTTYPGSASPYEPMKPIPEQLELAPRGDSGVPPEPPGGGGSPVPLTPLQKFLARRRLAEAKNATVRRFIPRNQRGAIGDLGDAQRLDQLVKSLLNTSRDREGIKAGDTVRLMNGKVGKVLKVTEDGRYQVRHDDGSFDTVPVQGINYKYKPANQVVNAVGYPKARPLGAGPGNKQRGAVGDLGKAKVEAARRRYVEAGTHLNVAMSRAGINDKALWDRAFDKVLENHNDFNSVQGLDEATRKLHAEAQRWMNSDQAQALGLKTTHEAIAKEDAEEAISNAKQRHPFSGVGKKQGGAIDPRVFLNLHPEVKDTKVVDEQGLPKVVYHGTSKDVPFRDIKTNRRGAWFTEYPRIASEFATSNDSQRMTYDPITKTFTHINTASRVMPVYLDLKNPYRMDEKTAEILRTTETYTKTQRDIFDKLKQEGFDGVDFGNGTWVVFDKKSIHSAISPESKPNPVKGPGRKQAGVLNLGAFWSKKPKATTSDSGLEPAEARDIRVPLSEEAKIDIMYRMWDRSQNLQDFKDALRLIRKRNSNFPQAAIDRADELYQRFEEGYRPEKSIYSTLSNKNQRDTIALRTVEQALNEIEVRGQSLQKTELKDSDDLGYPSKQFASPMHIITLNWDKPSGKLFATVHGILTDINAQWADKLGEFMQHNKPYLRLSRKSQKMVDRAEEFWDNHQVLKDRGLMWPTKEMLMDRNYTKLSSEEADAYLAHSKGYEEAYPAAGIERPPIPGYMPHVWQGSYRVNIVGPDGLARVERTTFSWQAKKLAKEWEKKGYKTTVVDPQITNKGDYIRVLEESLQQANRYGKAGVGVAKRIEQELFKSLEGTITESMERKGVEGFIKNRVPDNFNPLHPLDSINSMVRTRINNNIRSGLFEKAMNDFARAGRNRQIIEGVAHPFYRNIANMRQAKNLVDGVGDMIAVATGMRKQEMDAPDRWGKRVLISMGLPPNGIRDFIQAANAFARVQRINSANFGFTAEHLYFGFPGLFDLRRMDLDRASTGEKRGSYLKAIGEFGKDFITFGTMRSKEGQLAEKWARDNGVYGGHYYDEPEFKSTGGKIVGAATHGALTLVVNRMKAVNFHMAYRYFKDIMPEQEALNAAKQHTKKVMQSFDPLDRPEIFNEGTPGLAVRTFNQIKLYNLSRIGEMIKSIHDSAKQGDYVTAANHMVNLLGLAALFTALGGAAGLPFHEDWEWLRKKGEENFPMWTIGGESVWQSYEELMARAGIPHFIIFGMMPKLTGMDTRHTFEINVGNVFSGAGIEAVDAFSTFVLSKLSGWITGKEDPRTTYKNVKKLLPTTAVPWLEDYEAQKLGGNIPNSRLEPLSPRSEQEDLIFKLTSKRATSESERNEIQSLLKDIDARNTKIREAYVDMIVKKMSGFDTGNKEVNELIDDALKSNIGFDAQRLNEQITKKIRDEHLSQAIKYIMEAARGNNLNLKAQRFRDMQMLLQGERLGK